MDAKTLVNLAVRFRENKEFIINEETTKHSLVIPFIGSLGYDTASPREVRPEYAAEFTAHDGKRLPDRMDYAIFDRTGKKIRLVLEVKPLGGDIDRRSPQLARYMSQLPDLRFGIMTDGCNYHFYSDLEQPNVMDERPFFTFSLSDPKLEYESVAKFLTKFSGEEFDAESLISEAEDSNYRQGMIDKLSAALRHPAASISFVKWLSEGIYPGLRTQTVMERLGRIAGESVRPAVLRVLGTDLLNDLRSRIQEAGTLEKEEFEPSAIAAPAGADTDMEGVQKKAREILTTEEELAFFEKVKDLCVRAGVESTDILYKDTLYYFNVSFKKPTKWFVRFFGDAQRKGITLWVPSEEAMSLAEGFEVEDAPQSFGVSRIYMSSIDQISALEKVILRSLEICRG
jgi:hypothetical protein